MKFNLNKKNWQKVKFGDLVVQQKESISIEDRQLGDRYIAGEHMDTEDIHIRRWGEIDGSYLGPAFHRTFKKGDILYGSRRTYLKKVAVAHFDGITSNTTFVIRPNEEIIDPRLVPFLMLSDKFTQHSVKNSKGSVNPYINFKDIAKFELFLPPLDEQKKLADLLWAGDELSNKKSDLIFSLNLYKNTLIEDTLFRSKEFNEVKLGDLGQLLGGVTFKNTDLKDGYSKTTTAVIRANNIKDNKMVFEDMYFVTDDKVQQNKILKDGDIAICMSNGNPNLVGKSAIVSTEKYPKISVGAFCSAFRPNHKNKEIVQLIFESYTYSQKILKFVSGTNINNLRPDDLKNIKLRISKNISSKGINKIFKIFSSIKLNNENLVQLQKVNKSIINNIFS